MGFKPNQAQPCASIGLSELLAWGLSLPCITWISYFAIVEEAMRHRVRGSSTYDRRPSQQDLICASRVYLRLFER
jgi:hypothetical protein